MCVVFLYFDILAELLSDFSFGHSSEVVKFCSASSTLAENFNTLEHGRIERENSLDTNAVRYFPDDERLVYAFATAGNHDTLEVLDTFFFALDHADCYVNGVTRFEIRHFDEVFAIFCFSDFYCLFGNHVIHKN